QSVSGAAAGSEGGQDWTEVKPEHIPLWFVNRACEELDCGSALSLEKKTVPDREAVHFNPRRCLDSSLIDCFESDTRSSPDSLDLTCSDSVRLVGGRSLCSGSLQIQDQSLAQSWAGVCEGALDRRGAEVLCRELGCGAPLLQGALSPLGQTFHCEGNESKLMDCNRTRTGPETCPTLNLTCKEPLRLVGGASRCEGRWRRSSEESGDEWCPLTTGTWRRRPPCVETWTVDQLFLQKRDTGLTVKCGSSTLLCEEELCERLSLRSWLI
uniref:SRCR domain-containing protein n=1 Tax=Neogobius melanostomus TaxID=47308 RepID=A0A8C6UGW1_9GOBI